MMPLGCAHSVEWLWLVIMLLVHAAVAEFPPPSSSYDLNQDWISGITAKGPNGCFIPPRASSAPYPTCTGGGNKSNRSLEYIRQAGWMLAPKLYMHPNETSFLMDPAKWLQQPQQPVYNPLNYSVVNLTADNQLQTQFGLLAVLGAPFFSSHIYEGFAPDATIAPVTTQQLHQRTQGDPIDSNGRSTAKLYYTAMDAADDLTLSGLFPRGKVVTFKFHFFYPWNGCSNQLFAMNIRAKYQGVEYVMCSPGVHEGDWEHMALWVCVDDWDDEQPWRAIKRVQYSAHSWNSQYDCSPDPATNECVFETDDQGWMRLVAYAGLNSHAMYPVASPLVVYQKVSASFLLNVDGVYIGDRTKRGALFHPNATNTLLLPFAREMNATEQVKYAWALYAGSWGGYTATTGSKFSITCLFDNLTRFGPCPSENPATQFLLGALDLKGDAVAEADLIWDCTINTKGFAQVSAITGPLMRDFTYRWTGATQPPIYDPSGKLAKVSTEISCPFSGDPTATDSNPDTNLSPYKLGPFLLGITLLLIFSGVFFGLALYWPRLHTEGEMRSLLHAVRTVPHLVCDSVEMTKEYAATRHIIWMTLALVVYITGVVLAVLGIKDVFTALRKVYYTSLYATIEHAFIGVLIVFGSWEINVMLLVIVLRNQDAVKMLFCQMRNPFRHWRGANRFGSRVQSVVACLQVIAVNTTVLLFAFGFTIVVIAIVMQNACSATLSSLFESTPVSDLCLDLSVIGIDKQLCGSDLANVCNMWYGLHIEFLPFGALLIILSHLLFLAMAVHQCVSLQNLQAVIDDIDTEKSDKALVAGESTAGQGTAAAEPHEKEIMTKPAPLVLDVEAAATTDALTEK